MDNSAPKKETRVLITNIGTFLGTQLAHKLIDIGYEVYGAGKKQPDENLLGSSGFTFLDLDLAQPLPTYLPRFNTIIHLSSDNTQDRSIDTVKLSTASEKIIDIAAGSDTSVIFLAKITDMEKISSHCETGNRQNPKFIAIGHVYGPNMNLFGKNTPENISFFENNELINLISQAIETDKVILDHEGTELIYPTYIDDATSALVQEITAEKKYKQIKFIISNPAQSALSLAYEIQSKTHVILHKELNLFFSGPEGHERPKPQPQIRIHDTIPAHKHSFAEGLETTLLYFEEKGLVNKVEIVTQKEDKPITTLNFGGDQFPGLPKDKSQKIKLKFGITPKLPFTGGKFKKVVLVSIFLLFIFIVRLVFNFAQGTNELKEARDALKVADFQKSQEKAQDAVGHFSSAQNSANLLTAPLRFANPIKSFNFGVQSLEVGANALLNFSEGVKIISLNLSSITSTNSSKTNLDLETPVASLTKSYFESEHAKTLAESAASSFILKSQFKRAHDAFSELSHLSLNAQELTTLTPDITGTNSKKTYLVLIMNNAELRPGGGFIGNFAEISFEDNKLKKVEVEDIYTIDGQLKEIINPPPQLTQKLGVKQLYLRDSNWSTDFRVNAQTARDFYKKETGKTVDGVIALDLTLLENLLAKIGSVRLEDYNEDITSENLLEKGQYYSEVGFFPGSTQKRDFFATLTANLLTIIFDSLSSNSPQVGNAPWMALFETISQGLLEKHIMLSFDNENLSALIKSKGWDNPLPPKNYNPKDDTASTRDFLELSEANIGANKVNRYLTREVAYDMTISRDADLVATLTLTYKNESPADTWPGGTYVNYLRITAPANSTLESYRENGKEVDINQLERGKIVSVVETTQVGELTQFATLVEIPVKQTKTLTFKYRIPKNIKLETAPTYELYISKQPGTLSDPLKFTFNLPGYLKIDSVNGNDEENGKQNMTAETNLTIDRHWQIKISRK